MARLESTGTIVTRVLQPPANARSPHGRPSPHASLTQDELQAFRDHLRVVVATAFALVGDEAVPNATTGRPLTRQDLITPYLVAALDDPRLTRVSVLQLLQGCCDAIREGVRPGIDTRLIVDAQGRGVDQRFEGAPVLVAVLRPEAAIARVQGAGGYTFATGMVCAGDLFRCDVGDGSTDFHHEVPAGAERGPVVAYYAIAHHGERAVRGHVLTTQQLSTARWASPVRWHRSWSLQHTIGETTALELLVRDLPECARDARVRAWQYPRAVLDPFTSLGAARNAWLPGKPADFDGWGGQSARVVPTEVLRGIRSYLRADRGRAQRHRSTLVSIAFQLLSRRLQDLRVQRASTSARSATA